MNSEFHATPPLDPELSVIGLLNVLLRHIRLIVLLPVFMAVAAGALSFLTEQHVAESSFAPEQTASNLSNLAGLASQFGVSVSPSQTGESLDFYVRLVTSRDLLEEVLETEYVVQAAEGERKSGPLLDILEIEEEDPRERQRAGVDWLRDNIEVSLDAAAGIITLRTTAPWVELAEDLNQRLLDLINSFNLDRRQSRAEAERRFVEGEVAKALDELRAGEQDLEDFLDRNRVIETSPQLMFARDRLQRRVDLLQQVYTGLVQALQQARIEEVRNTPVITIIAFPQDSAEPTGSLLTWVGLGLLFGWALAVGIAFSRDYLDLKRRQGDSDYREFERLRAQVPLLGRKAPKQ